VVKAERGCLQSPSRGFSVFALALERAKADWVFNWSCSYECTGFVGSACQKVPPLSCLAASSQRCSPS